MLRGYRWWPGSTVKKLCPAQTIYVTQQVPSHHRHQYGGPLLLMLASELLSLRGQPKSDLLQVTPTKWPPVEGDTHACPPPTAQPWGILLSWVVVMDDILKGNRWEAWRSFSPTLGSSVNLAPFLWQRSTLPLGWLFNREQVLLDTLDKGTRHGYDRAGFKTKEVFT